MTKRQMKPSPPTPEQIAEFNASAETQLSCDLVKLLNAYAYKIDHPRDIAFALCYVLIQYIMAVETTDEERTTFSEAGKIATRILKTSIKHTRYGVGMDNEVIDLLTNQEISPGGLKQ
jgi:hypothetical protein